MAHSHESAVSVQPGQLSERRFLSAPTRRTNFSSLLGGLGAATLGAATWSNWVRDTPLEFAPALFAIGTVAVIVSVAMGDPTAAPLRVGDAGVAVERGGTDLYRIGWYEIERVRFENRAITVETSNKRIAVSADTHEGAAGWIVKEALARIPSKVQIPEETAIQLQRGASDHGDVVIAEPPQVAGRHCRASGNVISFEQDAVRCERCGEVYDRKHVPADCLACSAPLGEKAAAAGKTAAL